MKIPYLFSPALRGLVASAAMLGVLSGCLNAPMVDTSKYSAPKSVVIEDFPDMKAAAVIGVVVPKSYAFPGFHFSRNADFFYMDDELDELPADAPPMFKYQSAGLLDGLIVGMVAGSEAATQKRAEGFHGAVLARLPGFDMRKDFLASLRKSLEAQGIAVTVAPSGRRSYPRHRWPAADKDGNKYPLGPLASSPAVDADLLVQVSPVAFYMAPGGLNAYRRNVTLGVALYNGRTKQFLGRQTLEFSNSGFDYQYMKFDTLVGDIPAAAPALRDAVLSLVPQLVDLINARPVK
ncbi:hypothetical protein [Massilia antarctica]|uniref:hypothetical protein n=1 Tax=Massilia antarctica TaxID=2765360 RepID=UPI0011AED1B5|nr:hypothetical protein [Massilia sp. H27-R4]MCY0915103.1 hypothetical protein [Massilia sp. H27-R4]